MRILPVAAILLSSSIAAAQAPGQTLSYTEDYEPAPAPEVKVETISYRKQVLIADGLSVLAIGMGPMLAQNGGNGETVTLLGVAGYLVGAPLVHLAHGRGGAAFASLGLRTALPIVGALAGLKLGPNDVSCGQSEDPEGLGGGGGGCPSVSITGAATGLLLGSIAAVVIDAKYLARYQTKRTIPTWSASVQNVRGGGMTVGVSGAF